MVMNLLEHPDVFPDHRYHPLCGQKWQGEIECGALAGRGLDPDAPAMPFDDLFAHGQPDAGAGELLAAVQALKNDENALGVLRVDPDAVVVN